MADSTSRSLFSLSKFLSLETETRLAAEDEDEEEEGEINEYWASLIEDEEYLGILLDKERAVHYIESHVNDWIKIRRLEAIQWIFNTSSHLRFQFHTAYLSVTYIDRFLSKQHITGDRPWAIRLLASACLSLAVKMNERTIKASWVLSLLQTEEFRFKKSVFQRMELRVLTTLDWRMRSITPFHFIRYFISSFCKGSSEETSFIHLISQIICAATHDMKMMTHRSSTIALAATLMAMDEDLSRESMEMKVKSTWVNQLFDHVDVYICYSRMMKLKPSQAKTFKPSKGRESVKRKRS